MNAIRLKLIQSGAVKASPQPVAKVVRAVRGNDVTASKARKAMAILACAGWTRV